MSGIDASSLTPVARLVLAIACLLGAALPIWGLLLWIARSSAAWHVAADNVWLRLLAGVYATIGTALIAWGACAQLLPPDSLTEQRIVILVWMGQVGLLIVAVELVKRRRGGGRWSSVTRFAAQLAGPVDPNPAAPYAGWKTRVLGVREDPGSTAIRLRPYGIWETIAFPLGMLVGMGVVASVQPGSGTQEQRVVRGLILLATSLIFGLVGALVAHVLAGREEMVTVSGGTLTVDRELLRWPKVRRRRAYGVSRVMNLRAVEPPPMKTSGRYARPIPSPWLLNLEFDYEGGTVRFGAGLVGPDADLVLRTLARAMSAPTPS